MRSAAVALVLLALVTPGAAAAADRSPKGGNALERDAGQCVKRARDDQRTCVRTETEKCRQHFEIDLEGCFKADASCARKCIDAEKACRQSPKTDEQGCRLACASDLKVELAQCAKKADVHGCEAPARVKALKCRQQCTAASAPKVQECLGEFDDCLGVCIRASAR